MKAIATILLLASLSAHADDWHGTDKVKHVAAGAVIASAVTAATRSEHHGIAAGCAVGIAKEAYDSRSIGHQVSVRDALVTCVGAALGAKLAGFYVTPRAFVYTRSF